MPKAIPQGFHSITPYLVCADAKAAIDFYKTALGATEIYRLPMPDGRVGHAEIEIGDSRIMLADEDRAHGYRSARTIGGSPIGICLYTERVDERVARFVAAGGKVKRALQDQFYGDRSAIVEDPEGYQWTLSQHVEDVSPAEMQARANQLYGVSGK